mgnify:CR=1 FL=1
MKKAVITTGGKQYLVYEGEVLDIDLLKTSDKDLSLDALLLIDEEKVVVGTPLAEGVKVKIEVVESQIKADKVTAIRYKAKKRVKKIHGHRQTLTKIKVISIK